MFRELPCYDLLLETMVYLISKQSFQKGNQLWIFTVQLKTEIFEEFEKEKTISSENYVLFISMVIDHANGRTTICQMPPEYFRYSRLLRIVVGW